MGLWLCHHCVLSTAHPMGGSNSLIESCARLHASSLSAASLPGLVEVPAAPAQDGTPVRGQVAIANPVTLTLVLCSTEPLKTVIASALCSRTQPCDSGVPFTGSYSWRPIGLPSTKWTKKFKPWGVRGFLSRTVNLPSGVQFEPPSMFLGGSQGRGQQCPC